MRFYQGDRVFVKHNGKNYPAKVTPEEGFISSGEQHYVVEFENEIPPYNNDPFITPFFGEDKKANVGESKLTLELSKYKLLRQKLRDVMIPLEKKIQEDLVRCDEQAETESEQARLEIEKAHDAEMLEEVLELRKNKNVDDGATDTESTYSDKSNFSGSVDGASDTESIPDSNYSGKSNFSGSVGSDSDIVKPKQSIFERMFNISGKGGKSKKSRKTKKSKK